MRAVVTTLVCLGIICIGFADCLPTATWIDGQWCPKDVILDVDKCLELDYSDGSKRYVLLRMKGTSHDAFYGFDVNDNNTKVSLSILDGKWNILIREGKSQMTAFEFDPKTKRSRLVDLGDDEEEEELEELGESNYEELKHANNTIANNIMLPTSGYKMNLMFICDMSCQLKLQKTRGGTKGRMNSLLANLRIYFSDPEFPTIIHPYLSEIFYTGDTFEATGSDLR